MTKEEVLKEQLYQQEVFVLAYLYAHPEQFEESGLNKTHFSNNDTSLLFELMNANYRHNQKVLVNGHQVIDGMWKNKRFTCLLDNQEMILKVFSITDEYLVTKSIFNGYVRYMKQIQR